MLQVHTFIPSIDLLYSVLKQLTADYFKLRQKKNLSRSLDELHIKLLMCTHANTDKELCVYVSRTVEWNPCQSLASLSSLLSWINGNVTAYSHHPVHTHISFAPSFLTKMGTVTLHFPSHKTHKVNDGWLLFFLPQQLRFPSVWPGVLLISLAPKSRLWTITPIKSELKCSTRIQPVTLTPAQT